MGTALRCIAALTLMLSVTSCMSEGWGVPSPTRTGIVPEEGHFGLAGGDPEDALSFQVISDGSEQYVSYSSDGYNYLTIPIENGGFYYEWGEIGGTHCPTDAFCVSGWFTSPTEAQGYKRFGSACRTRTRVTSWQSVLSASE